MTRAPSRLPRLLSIPHVAEHLGVCTKTVRRLIQSGDLLATRVGRAIRVTETDLDAYLARGRSHVQYRPGLSTPSGRIVTCRIRTETHNGA